MLSDLTIDLSEIAERGDVGGLSIRVGIGVSS